jgi:hypothetical protein
MNVSPDAGPLNVDHRGGTAHAATALFAMVWEALARVLGTAATAAIVRRALRRAAASNADLADLVIVHDDLRYRYTLPASWSQPGERGTLALRGLSAEIGRLLVELTGTVVIRLLEQIPELRAAGIHWRPEERN